MPEIPNTSALPDKFSRAQEFRLRLLRALKTSGLTQSALARAVGTDRSTLSQALSDTGTRLPGAHVVGACASVLGVSSDWLLGLSDRPETAADLLSNSFELSHAPRALVDQQIYDWHREAAGYKIRHVPATLPDMLKTKEMLTWEYGPHLGRTAKQAINASQDRLNWMRQAGSEYEIALPLYEIDCFIRATGYYSGLPADIRRDQTDHLIALTQQLYPRLRLYQFDARRLYSAPVTIFGPLLAVLYTGGHYMAFRDRRRIETFTQDFDTLIREAKYTARDCPTLLSDMRQMIR
ncbi:helix-turn-helix transcriptional regulator [Sulfitobacter sp. M57]|uniref:helix-turn-helix domain-containing protein n=1 Tax=unclassified Sulfitobacter TaxID=196795 RepID=UPI0023E1896A|nr:MULTISPECIES: helix-turn-helix transcriptional regulator [unclassified Sulfitobacter]MDF3413127.1 helix-turn-helix transcriptional regulator [Sulfitobacter sp. KE5]MDF3421590.1 helix-turn-helix transcriptional regulator [Sulfitobacter sp. KE43]MDF3431676.1 helix-turn-helix transcriptional regulator [Sulfitobacter sp. KE42]MDF3457317.1 helix-turn-helix transcriptional regulator [Sulfitobacter sp. S74]MDF3461219.1 helix-turn-helix transcriptional regulator [Sulfitobacter sp. Ks18]